MSFIMRKAVFLVLMLLISVNGRHLGAAFDDPPTEWIDTSTGHRIVRLSREPGSASLYFHQNAYSPDGRKLVITTPSGLSTIDLKTGAIEEVVKGRVNVIVTGRKSGLVYYSKRVDNQSVICATYLDTHETREIAKIPRGSIASVNADETLLLGTYNETEIPPPGQPPTTGPDGKPFNIAEQKELSLNDRYELHIPMAMFTANIKTGEIKVIHRNTEWLNHLQFSPIDPNLIMFCHEGPWHKVDRIWTIHADGTGLTKIHARTMNMEIAGHEFFSADGKTIWYDLQTPRGEDFWVAGYEIATGHRTWYHLQRDEWSVHFNVAPNGGFFAGDGGDDKMVAHAKDGKWIYLFRPERIPDVAGIKNPNSGKLIDTGFFKSERLVNMSKHDYHLEPNVTFTPDMKWIVFRSNMFGPTQVFAVEIEKASQN